MSSIRVLLVDDFKDWLRQVSLLLQARPGCQVIAEASDGSVNSADVRVIQCRGGLRFTPEALKDSRVVEHLGRQELQSYPTMESRVLSLVNNAHPAAPELLDDAVVRNGLADERVCA